MLLGRPRERNVERPCQPSCGPYGRQASAEARSAFCDRRTAGRRSVLCPETGWIRQANQSTSSSFATGKLPLRANRRGFESPCSGPSSGSRAASASTNAPPPASSRGLRVASRGLQSPALGAPKRRTPPGTRRRGADPYRPTRPWALGSRRRLTPRSAARRQAGPLHRFVRRHATPARAAHGSPRTHSSSPRRRRPAHSSDSGTRGKAISRPRCPRTTRRRQ